MKPYEGISLSEAIKQNRLPEFIRQAEERLKELGAEHPEAARLDAALTKAIKTKRSEDQT
jgi:hypothetical protein